MEKSASLTPFMTMYIKMKKLLLPILTLALPLLCSQPGLADPVETTQNLAQQLVAESDWDGAAIEYRRLAMTAESHSDQHAYRWLSAYYYRLQQEPQVASGQLDEIQQANDIMSSHTDLLRAGLATDRNQWGEAAFYLESLKHNPALSAETKTYVQRQLAQVYMHDGRTEKALRTLQGDSERIAAIETYLGGKDKNPTLGGWLGLIPGLGYAYAGEYANMTRSIILNSLFIFGMVHTAQEDQWGAFTAITFFEITWYTGSIYGGIDASHRYNQRRKQTVLDALGGGLWMEPDLGTVPTLNLKFRF